MSKRIKEKKRPPVPREFEYTSPDDDTILITYIENEGRKYVELSRFREVEPDEDGKAPSPTKETFVLDADAIFEIADELRPRESHGLTAPAVTDHRETRSDIIESQVSEIMERMDDSVEPVQSFVPDQESGYDRLRTGVSIGDQNAIEDTPPEYKIDKTASDNPTWKIEAADRKNKSRPAYNKTGHKGEGFKRRVKPSDMI